MATTVSVEFEEHEDSPVERGDRESGFEFSRIFLTHYADRFTFLRDMFTGGVDGRAKAYHEDFADLLCFSFDIERIENYPTGPSSITDPEQQIIDHDTTAKITIEYRPIEFTGSGPDEMKAGTFATYNQGQSVEFVDISPESVAPEGADANERVPPNERIVVPFFSTRHEITWHQVQDPPWSLISALKGHVNNASIQIPTTSLVLPAETLLFAESSSRQTIRYDGEITTELTLVFLEKRQVFLGGSASYGWNHKFNSKTKSYDRIVVAGGSTPLFPSADLLSIFR